MTFYDKKQKEQEVARFFADYFFIWNNNPLEILQDKDDREIDCVVYCWKDKIKLQIVSCEHNIIPIQIEAQKHKWKVFDINNDWVEDIIYAIEKKSSHYEPDLLMDIYLLIHNESWDISSEYLIDKTSIVCDKSFFKWIFFLTLPDNDNKKTYPTLDTWNIIRLK